MTSEASQSTPCEESIDFEYSFRLCMCAVVLSAAEERDDVLTAHGSERRA